MNQRTGFVGRKMWHMVGYTSMFDGKRSPLPLWWLMGQILIAVVCVASLSAAGERPSPTEAVRQTIDEIMNILADPSLQHPDKVGARRELVRIAASRLMDYEEMGKRTLGANWQKLNPAQQQEFQSLFKTFLSKSYETRFDEYAGEKVQYLGERIIKDFAEIRTILKSRNTEVPMNFRLMWKSGRWRVYDIVIDGVSLVKNYRAQFARILRTASFEALLAKLRTKTDLASEIVTAHE